EVGFSGEVLNGFGVDIQALEQRLVEELRQSLVGSPLPEARHELLGILLEVAKRLPQKREGHHPLPLLDQVQVRRRDAEVSGSIRLLDVARHPTASQPIPYVYIERAFVHGAFIHSGSGKQALGNCGRFQAASEGFPCRSRRGMSTRWPC